MRLVHQPLVYAFGAPTTRLRIWCTPEALTNQGGGASVYRPRSLLWYRSKSPSKQAYDTTCISCPWIRLNRAIKLVRTLISERAQISNHSTTPPKRYTTATTRSYPSTTCWKVGSWGLRTYLQFCILIQVLVRFTGSYRREYRPIQNPYPQPTFEPRTPIPTTPSTNTSDLPQTPYGDPLPFCKLLRTANRFYGPYKNSATRYILLHYIQYGRPQQTSQWRSKEVETRSQPYVYKRH